LFINIDYNKRPKEAKLHLAKPNKRVVSHIYEKFNDNLSVKLGNINELSFSIPHFITDEATGNAIINPHVDLIKEKMLVRVTLESYKEWYIVDSIEEDSDETDTFNVTAFSLGYELKGKRISGLVEEGINATSLLTLLLESTVWKIGEVDPMFDVMFRSFDSSTDSNVLDCIVQAGETYGALIVWNTISRTVSFKDATKNGRFRGLTVSYGRFLRSLKRTRTTDEMTTRMYVYGNEDISIHSVNPTGQSYIEDFSFFMYPFERDANREVISSSHFMSDELCHAILDHKILLEQNAPNINQKNTELTTKRTTLVTEQTELDQLNLELQNILNLLDVAKSAEDEEAVILRVQERDNKESEIQAQQLVVLQLENEIATLESQITTLQDTISHQANFTPELVDELTLYVHESTWRDDRYIDSQELYNDAIKKFEEIRQPKVVIEASIDNLLNIVEEQYYWDKLTLGDLIKIKYKEMNIEYMAKIIEINYDFENEEANLVIANTTDLLNDTDKLVQLLYSNSSASSLVQNNKYKWDKVNAVEKQVISLITNEWDATKQKITAGVNNSVEIGNRGVIIKNPDYPDEVVIMQSGVIALSKDGGETWKTAIKPDGIVAERLIGQIIAGQNLLITNSTGSFTMDNSGAVFDVGSFIVRSGNGSNLVDDWNSASDFINSYADDNLLTSLEKSKVKDEWSTIATEYSSKASTINAYYGEEQDTYSYISNYKNAYTALYDYLHVTLQSDGFTIMNVDNMSNTSIVDGETYRTKFNNYYNSRTELDNQLVIRALDVAKDAQDKVNEVMDDVVYKTELHSTKGDTFFNGNISTTVYAVVYRGMDNITSTLPNSAFNWKKADQNGVIDTVWTNAHTGVGSTIEIGKDDVYRKAIFWCDIIL
jgi:phage minor structural protein